MRILMITHENDLSGANKSLLSLIEVLKNEFEINVLINEKKGELTKKLDSIGIPYYFSRYSWCFAHDRVNKFKKIYRYLIDLIYYYVNRLSYRKTLKFIKSNNYDLIYTNTSVIDIGWYLSSKIGIKHLWHIREFGKEDFNFHRLHTKKYYQTMYNDASEIVVISESLKNKYSEIVSSNKIKVVYNGFDTNLISCKEPYVNSKAVKNIIVVGQVSVSKGQEQAIRACRKLIEKGYDICLHIVGNIDNNYLLKFVPDYRSYNWLKLHGQVNNVNEIRKNMDIELVCSKSEAFGRVTIEAMLNKLPVIGSNTAGTAELINDGDTGLLYKNGDIEDLANKILSLINNPDLRKTLVENAYTFASEFKIGNTAKEIKMIIQELNRR